MIKILFFSRIHKNELCEYDFIINDILPEKIKKSSHFLSLEEVRNSEDKFDVFVYSCRDPQNYPWGHMPTYDEVFECVLKTQPKIIIQLSDEFYFEDLQIHNHLANYCELFLRQYHHESYSYTMNTIHIPLGYCNDIKVRGGDTLNILQRNYTWSFIGEMKSDRWDLVNAFNQIENGFNGSGFSKDEMSKIYLNSIFAPSGRGNSSLDCFRLYETSMMGCIPVVVGDQHELNITFMYEENPPWIFAESWNGAVFKCKELLNNSEALQKKQEDVLNWWKFRIEDIREKVRIALLPKVETIKVVQIGSNKGNDKLSKHLLGNYQSLEFGLFVEPNKLHIDKLKKCYRKYPNAIIENIAVKLPGDEKEDLKIYYHIDDTPDYEIASTKIEHILWHTHLPNRENNYEGKIESFSVPALTIEELFDKYKITELDWLLIDVEGLDADLILSFDWKKYNIRKVEFEFLHLCDRSELIKNIFLNMGYVQVTSLNPADDWAFVSREEYRKIHEKNINKLKNFPPVHFISTTDSEERRNLLYKKFDEYDITNVSPHIFKRYEEGDYILNGDLIDKMVGPGRGPLTSHLRAIKGWYYGTDEPYAFFCEDDLSFDTVKYWNFTWKEFFDKLPKDWECVQLCWVREKYRNFSIEFRNRCWCDWSGCAYLISREYAKKVVENYYYDDEFHLDITGNDIEHRPEWAKIPVIETVIFSSVGRVYGFPLFVEDVFNCHTTWRWGSGNEVNIYSHLETMGWWKGKGQFLELDEIFKNI